MMQKVRGGLIFWEGNQGYSHSSERRLSGHPPLVISAVVLQRCIIAALGIYGESAA
jgi:hypothetical protein